MSLTVEYIKISLEALYIVEDFDYSEFIFCSYARLESSNNRRFNTLGNRAYIITHSLKKMKKEEESYQSTFYFLYTIHRVIIPIASFRSLVDHYAISITTKKNIPQNISFMKCSFLFLIVTPLFLCNDAPLQASYLSLSSVGSVYYAHSHPVSS